MRGEIALSADIINGKELAHKLKKEMSKEVLQLKEQGLIPHLTVILIGDNPASRSYVKGKKKPLVKLVYLLT